MVVPGRVPSPHAVGAVRSAISRGAARRSLCRRGVKSGKVGSGKGYKLVIRASITKQVPWGIRYAGAGPGYCWIATPLFDGDNPAIYAVIITTNDRGQSMPYIDKASRKRLAEGAVAQTPGELNYLITMLLDDYIQRKGGVRYAHINEVVGVLECAKLELYRRVAAPYEDGKCAASGEVYTL